MSPTLVAELQAAMGQVDEAFASLERAYELRCGYLVYLTESCPSLHTDPRWDDLVDRVGLPAKVPFT